MKNLFSRKFRTSISRSLTNFRGWKTNRKIVVIESDDWGSIRMSSKESLQTLKRAGLKVENCHYVQNDALASEDDLERLFEVLMAYEDGNGQYPVITANAIMANPDFEKIKESGFNEYHFESFKTTLSRYPNHKNSFKIWGDGMSNGVFYPQFHGREHLQVQRWMNQIRNQSSETRLAFDLGVFGLSTTVTSENRKSYMAAYDWEDVMDKKFIFQAVDEGLDIFKQIFGFQSYSSIAPNYVWHEELEEIMLEKGVHVIQGSSVQKSPEIGVTSFRKIRHYTGQENKNGQKYLVRNCKFEPSSDRSIDWVSNCLRDIELAFKWKKPAIIEMHRVNFVGFINEKNRDLNLILLNKLLSEINRRWPEVEFMSSEDLGRLILENHE
ncbi:hypothetical protein [Rhodohalobacter sp.]|uniref:hypothetical protein n=1 Tax=Rhodohalobacter sp. TaxID=1974210 RepID=UPI002ACED029|nr:hypothetical protein [Rhodohalobacter sp.]MDZ7755189.1 hypothetical protein [Rhodohalobacter sp.]